jgi:hypothetical protein
MFADGLSRAQRFSRSPFGKAQAVPMYVCDRCGFGSTAFRVEAASTHRADYPGCTGTIRMVFHQPAPVPILDDARSQPALRPDTGPTAAPPVGADELLAS